MGLRKKIKLSKLKVNTENYRFEPLETEEDAIDYMIKNQKDKLLNLAKDIIKHGLNPHEDTLVYPIPDSKGEYNVLEGNRRAISLKLLKDPSLIRGYENLSLKKKFKELNKQVKKSISEIECFIYKDPKEAEYWIGLKHGYGIRGVGTENWDPIQRERFREMTEGTSSMALQVIKKMKLTEKEQKARQRVCLALDVPTVQDALDLSKELADFVGIYKIGKQLHTAACREEIDIIGRIHRFGGDSFLDLKYHDTPNTVYEASKVLGRARVDMFNIHVAGGEEMCKKALEGARWRIIGRPRVIGVTVLTSLNNDDLAVQGLAINYDDLVRRRTELARMWDLDGIVCPASKAGALEKEFGSDFIYVTPGIKWAGKQGKGQKQLYTPDKAVQDCSSSILVIGSAITKSENKRETAYEILQAMAKHL